MKNTIELFNDALQAMSSTKSITETDLIFEKLIKYYFNTLDFLKFINLVLKYRNGMLRYYTLDINIPEFYKSKGDDILFDIISNPNIDNKNIDDLITILSEKNGSNTNNYIKQLIIEGYLEVGKFENDYIIDKDNDIDKIVNFIFDVFFLKSCSIDTNTEVNNLIKKMHKFDIEEFKFVKKYYPGYVTEELKDSIFDYTILRNFYYTKDVLQNSKFYINITDSGRLRVVDKTINYLINTRTTMEEIDDKLNQKDTKIDKTKIEISKIGKRVSKFEDRIIEIIAILMTAFSIIALNIQSMAKLLTDNIYTNLFILAFVNISVLTVCFGLFFLINEIKTKYNFNDTKSKNINGWFRNLIIIFVFMIVINGGLATYSKYLKTQEVIIKVEGKLMKNVEDKLRVENIELQEKLLKIEEKLNNYMEVKNSNLKE